MRLWHGGMPGLKRGDILTGGHNRHIAGCAICEARQAGVSPTVDPQAVYPDRVYVTSDREYARFYASLTWRGDLYQVKPLGEMIESVEDRFPTWAVPQARVITAYERCVRRTKCQILALARRWITEDMRADGRLDEWLALSNADRERVTREELQQMGMPIRQRWEAGRISTHA